MRTALVMTLALLASSCVSSSMIRLGETEFAPRGQDHPIIVYDSVEDVPRAFEKVARVLGEGGDFADWDEILARMQASARRAGADAIVLTSLGAARNGPEQDCDLRRVTAIAIRWKPVS